ncbi:MAG: DUF3316 domain-containing protein [Bacteroidales bacterium]|nr:DUF3316 domain-containing protein [Candidatus Liminaster caballi]
MMRRKLLLTLSLCSELLLMCCLPTSAVAQDKARPVTSTISLQTGQGAVRDTYLTPLLYGGRSTAVNYERWQMMSNLKWNTQQMTELSFLNADSNDAISSTWAGRLRYHFAAHKVWRIEHGNGMRWFVPNTVCVGPYLATEMGFNYNLKLANANNPATARLAEQAGLSVMANWKYSIRKQPCEVMLHVKAPMMGVAFVPEYGASYYETFYLDNTENTVHFTSLHNQQDLDIRLTTDIPLSVIRFLRRLDMTMRLGLSYHIETMDINNIVTRMNSAHFVIGWTYHYLPLSSRRKVNSIIKEPVYAY